MPVKTSSVGLALPAFLGRGLSFPLRLDPTGSRPSISQDDQNVLESMDMILQTDPTERPFLSKDGIPFGTRLRSVLFMTDVEAVQAIVKYECKRALDTWEPRIIVDDVQTSDSVSSVGGLEGTYVLATVSFRFRSTNRSDNRVTLFQYARK